MLTIQSAADARSDEVDGKIDRAGHAASRHQAPAEDPWPTPPHKTAAHTRDARLGFGGEARAGLSVQRPSAHWAIEGHHAWSRIALGLGIEFNPILDYAEGSIHPGSLSSYVVIQHRLQIRRLVLRQRFSVGLGILLDDYLEHARGSTGPALEVTMIGLAGRRQSPEIDGRRA